MAQYNYTEDNMINAALDVRDNGLSQNKSAQKHGLPQSTLSKRMGGQTAQKDQVQPH
jgi:hypothetical protein